MTSWRRRIFCASGCVTVPPLQLLEEGVCRTKLAVKQPQTALHTGSPLIFLLEYELVERGAVGGGDAITAAFSYAISVVLPCCNASPPFKLIFHLHNGHRCPGSYYLNRPSLWKVVNITGYYSLFLLIFNKTSSLYCLSGGHWGRFASRSPVAPNVSHVFFALPGFGGIKQSQPPTISLNSQQNEAQTCAIMRHTVKYVILHRDSQGDSHPRQQTAVPTPRCPDILVMCAAMTQHLWSKATPAHPRVLLARLSNAPPPAYSPPSPREQQLHLIITCE